jgi:hypothetical protein
MLRKPRLKSFAPQNKIEEKKSCELYFWQKGSKGCAEHEH